MSLQYPHESPRSVADKMRAERSLRLIDVRSKAEYRNGHAQGARSVPLDQLSREHLIDVFGNEHIGQDGKPLYLLCESGLRAEQAFEKLHQQGFSNLLLVEGGTQAWRQQGLPMQRHSKLPSLEQQTQMVLGGLILLALFKGAVIHPAFYVLIGLIAAGLIFAGITARCSLTALIARLPWNQREGTPVA